MYTFFLILISVNFIYLYRYSFLLRLFNLKDKNTNVPVLGGMYLFLNFFIIGVYYFYDPSNILFGEYFREFYIDQKQVSSREIFVFFLLPTFFFLMGLFDDKFNLNANYRIIISFIIITLFLLIDENFIIKTISYNEEIEIQLFSLSIFFTTICITGFIFALNMYDGINLQIGFHLLIIFTFFVFKGILINFFIIFIILILIFLYQNYNNKTYMGDSGVYFMGTIIALIFLKNYNIGILKIEEIIILSLVPILDMFRVIFLRILNGSHPFKKDNLHIHYVLQQKFKKRYLWQIGSILTLLNILILVTFNKANLVLFLTTTTYFSTIFYLLLIKKK